jgi:hypothetical protein
MRLLPAADQAGLPILIRSLSPSDFTRDRVSFCVRTCGRPLWKTEAFGGYRPYGFPFWNAVVGSVL